MQSPNLFLEKILYTRKNQWFPHNPSRARGSYNSGPVRHVWAGCGHPLQWSECGRWDAQTLVDCHWRLSRGWRRWCSSPSSYPRRLTSVRTEEGQKKGLQVRIWKLWDGHVLSNKPQHKTYHWENHLNLFNLPLSMPFWKRITIIYILEILKAKIKIKE